MKPLHLVIFTILGIMVTSMVVFVLNSELNTPLPNMALQNNGTLSGNVSSYVYGGPLGSVTNRSANYEVFVYAPDGITMAGKTFSNANAHYSLQLPAGKYTIYTYNEIKQKYFVSVFAGQNTVFNITSSIHVR
ncbi:exported protein of unknown function [Nitrosotalea devaniterrae]|uniref:Carboxypeptidase regulatory-like domain-containing protein n=1 Tax=Nitrosotalea devaniterrae TaxID=1078905 RepID=A0A128A1Z7_9ARCH|nr:exported protein of unknown function [Candidatus Nitrosotalea devanaterra]